MYPRDFAKSAPERAAAIIAASGEALSYAELECRANQGAHLFRKLGLKAGDGVAVLLENTLHYFVVYWAAQRAGLYITPISTRLTATEAAYIVNDCGARLLIASAEVGNTARSLAKDRSDLIPMVEGVFFCGEALATAQSWDAATGACPAMPIPDETAGFHMVYSSGTTGRPKGIKLPLTGGPVDAPIAMVELLRKRYAVEGEIRYLSPAPLYHTAPLMYSTSMQRLGGSVIVMQHFDPEAFLEAVEKYRITHVQMVPTMFVRLLKLPPAERRKYDLSSLKVVVHAAAPCPAEVKRQMIEWLGPIIHEYYGASEGAGSTAITSEEALRKPGSVGRASWGVLHICDETGNDLPAGAPGLIYFEGGLDFKYHNDDEKTASSRHPAHSNWATTGDIGYLDQEGYLFLTDRKAFMIISGGVNIYPQEAENVLIAHPKVADAAVFGVPNEDFGEEVKAVVQPVRWIDAGPDLEEELLVFCRSKIAAIKCPRSIDFDPNLPRHETGKLYKKQLRDRYWPAKS